MYAVPQVLGTTQQRRTPVHPRRKAGSKVMKHGMFVYVFGEWQFCGIIDDEFRQDFVDMQQGLDHVKTVKSIELPEVS